MITPLLGAKSWQLGTQYQENTTPDPRQRFNEAMDIWRARDAYNAQKLLWVLAFFLLFALMLWLSGCQDVVRAVATIHGYKGDIYASPCAPESLQAGHCVVKEGPQP